MSKEGREDARLARCARQGDADAFTLLVEKYQDRVYNVVYRMVGDRQEALDLAQDTFVRAFEGLHGFNARKPFGAWLLRIATNASIDRLRRRARTGEMHYAALGGAGADEAGAVVMELPGAEAEIPENVIVRNETADIVQRVLLGLPANYRAVLVLHHMEGLSYTEIAGVLGVPKNTAKTWAHRARKMLVDSLEEVV